MGHRASYAVRRGGSVDVYASQWGALTAAQDIFWGPAATELWMRRIDVRGWHDDLFGEAGVALDCDTRTLAWYERVLPRGPRALLHERLLAAVWARQGWTVRRVDGMPEIAEQVGVPGEIVEPIFLPEPKVGPWPLEGAWHGCALWVSRRRRGAWEDRAVSALLLVELLAAGPPVWDDGWDALPATPEAPAPGADALLIDEDRVVLRSAHRIWPGQQAVIRAGWPGRAVRFERADLSAHYAATGRPLPPRAEAPPPREWTTRELVDGHLGELRAWLLEVDHDRGPALLRAFAALAPPPFVTAPGSTEPLPDGHLDRAARDAVLAAAVRDALAAERPQG